MTRAKAFVIIAMGLVLFGLAVSPAAADAPITYTASESFTGIDPCTGGEMVFSISYEVTAHTHQNNYVAHWKRTGTTDTGYVMDHGVRTFQDNANISRNAFTDIWSHEDGSKFRVHGVFVFDFDSGDLMVLNFSEMCIGP